MRKVKKQKKNVRLQRERRERRKRMRLEAVLHGLSEGLTVKNIHRQTGLSEKSILKIMKSNPEKITFLLLKREYNG